jgi:hypothetical protein
VKSPVVGSCLALTCLAGIKYERYQAISMKLFFLLFLGWFGVESVVLFATANATHPLNPGGFIPLRIRHGHSGIPPRLKPVVGVTSRLHSEPGQDLRFPKL